MCQKFFLVRNAAYQHNAVGRHLTDHGEEQAQDLAQRIKKILGDEQNLDLTIWTSKAPRAKETAEIIKKSFPEAKFLVLKKLWSSKSEPPDLDWLLQKIKSFKGKNLIIVTHLEYVRDIPLRLGFKHSSMEYAQGVLIKNNKSICSEV